jgi:hypothetical protein
MAAARSGRLRCVSIPRLRRLLPIAIVAVLPVALQGRLWLNLWTCMGPRAWDGTGHFALARLYDQSIFPATFGWTNAYFGGIPFPNFYPPLFYWCVGFLHHTHFFSLPAAFKLVLGLPMLFLPVVIWMLARTLSGNDRVVAICTAVASIPILLDLRFQPYGLSYPSTFLIGLYTQPFGFVILILWYIVYMNSAGRSWRITLASVLLALTVLANFFNAVTCLFFIAATICNDLKEGFWWFSKQPTQKVRRDLAAHMKSPLIAFCLTLFWLAPVFSEYDYLVTRPQVLPPNQLFSRAYLIWYLLAIIGIWTWTRNPTRQMKPFLWACLGLACSLLFASTLSPRWFPFQAPRFIATLNFLLAVPVGYTIAGLLRLPHWFRTSRSWTRLKMLLLKKTRGADKTKRTVKAQLRDWLVGRSSPVPPIPKFLSPPFLKGSLGILLVALSFFLLDRPSYDLAFYTASSYQSVEEILHFATEHREGRYLVEIPVASSSEDAFDGRALNSYLGAQGNETLSVVFREASPNSIFFNAAVNAVSAYPDSFGISSVLSEDLDFRDQPLAKHLERARLLGTKYLVIFTYWMKNHIAAEKGVKEVFNSGDWTMFELAGERLPRARALQFKPALVVSDFSLKQRRENEYDFVRFAEEQFIDGWFDVLLARSPESKIDRIQNLDQFGTLILDRYAYENESAAFERLRNFAQGHLLILLSSDAPLFLRIQASISDFPLATTIERPLEEPGKWLEALAPTSRYGSSAIRKTWGEIRRALDSHKEATGASAITVNGNVRQNSIHIDITPTLEGKDLPVMIDTTYFPAWRRDDGKPIYAATPLFMITFVREPIRISYGRRWIDLVALFISGTTLFLLSVTVVFNYRIPFLRLVKRHFSI